MKSRKASRRKSQPAARTGWDAEHYNYFRDCDPARLAKADGVSLNQFIAVAVAEKVGAMETAAEFIQRKAAKAKPADLMRFLRGAPSTAPAKEDAL